jgi:chemotaxis protein methyltransferase CheR
MQPSKPQGSGSISAQNLAELSEVAHQLWGLQIGEKKRAVVEGRLGKLLAETGCDSLPSLIKVLRARNAPKVALSAFDVLSTNHTHFFREASHFDWLRSEILKPLTLDSQHPPRLRIWSAGCSNGCEPYSIAMVMADTLRSLRSIDARILATDLAVSELRTAKAGIYAPKSLEGLEPTLVARHFERHDGPDGPRFEVKPALRSLVRFGLLNLLEAWSFKGPFDAIFCRNVMIYFDEPTRRRLVERYLALLRPGGILFLGTSEGIAGKYDNLLALEASAYKKLK